MHLQSNQPIPGFNLCYFGIITVPHM
uniref:Uncharacterized protein n=1 Tax=Anguilla anguilla TaxID=7936 RepID=A0A0E9XP36_ANGAN